MICKGLLLLVHAACLLSLGSAGFTGNLEIPFIHDDIDVMVPVTIGTPNDDQGPQKFNALFDTGSYIMWLVKEENQFSQITGSRPFYSRRSSSFNELMSSFTGTYGKATITGSLGSDRVQIGEGDNAIVLTGQQFGLASEIPTIAFGALFDNDQAVIGINLVSTDLCTELSSPLLETMRHYYQRVPVIGFYINSKHHELSKITFDGDDTGLVDGRLHPHQVVTIDSKYNGWNVNVGKFTLRMKDGSVKTTQLPDSRHAQIITRKNALIIGPAHIIGALNNEIFKTANFQYNMDYSFTLEEGQKLEELLKPLPDVSVYIDNIEYVFRPDQYIRLRKGKYMSSLVSGKGESIVLGLGFMFHYYTKFDYENKQVHIGRAATQVGATA